MCIRDRSITTIDSAAPVFRKMLSAKVLTYAGLWSYSLYLWQQPFYKLYREGAAPTPLLILAAVLAALASFYLVEKPSRTALNRLLQNRMEKVVAAGRTA